MTLLSRIAGFVRDMVFGHVFGAGMIAGAFSIAFMVPNLFRRLFGEGALSAAMIPVLSARMRREGTPGAAQLVGRVVAWLTIVLAALIIAGELILWLADIALPLGERGTLTLRMTAAMLPYALLICLVAIIGGVLNVRGSFGTTAASPILLNVVLIVTLLLGNLLLPDQGLHQVWLLVGAVILSGILQLLLQGYDLRRRGIVLRPNLCTDDPDLCDIRRAMLPMLVGLAAVQINTFADSLIAMACVPHPGAPAVLYFAQRLYQFPLGVFGLAFATAVFPTLSAHAAAGDLDRLRSALTRSMRVVWFIGVASTLGLIVIARPLVQGAFEHGAFGAADTARVSRTLVAYALGVWSFGLNHILVRCFYALGERRTPVRISVWGVAINLTLNLSLVWKLEEVGLGLATTISSTVQTIWLLRALAGRIEPLEWRPLVASAARSVAAGALMVAGCLSAHRMLSAWRPESGALVILAVQFVVGVAVFVGAAVALRCRELRELVAR